MSTRDISFLRITYLRGPNIWTYRPVMEAWVDIGEFEQFPSNRLPGFVDRLVALLGGLQQHRCGVGEPGGFILRLREGTWMAHILEHVAIELQNLAGSQVGFGKARQTAEGSGIYKVAVRTRDEQVGRAALETGRELLLAMVDDRPFDLQAKVAVLRELVDNRCLGPSTAAIVDAAGERKIPAIRLNEGNLVQLGYGRSQRRIWTAETDRTSAIAEGIAGDKDLTKTLLKSVGVPVPEGRVVENPADAWEAAEEIGVPVVVKPTDGNHGRGVSLELTTREQVEAAFPVADAEGSEVIVERYIPGQEHRLLVVGGRVVAAGKGENIYLSGDGRSTVRELIETQLNSDPRRGVEEEFPLETIVLDKDPTMLLLLQRQGLDGDAVPAAAQRVLVQRNGNVSIDCTDEVCADVAAAVSLAARTVGLDVAGIDLVAQDMSRPLESQGGAIVEVNAGPSLLMHLKPALGQPRPVGQAIADHLFPATETGRIPLVGVTGGGETTLVARLTAWICQLAGRRIGLACRDGLFLDRRCIGTRDPTGFDSAQSLLMNRVVETVVIEGSARHILAEGVPYDRCQVGVLTGFHGESLAEFHVETDDQRYNVLRTQVDLVLPSGAAVLNATEPRLVEMAGLSDGDVVLYAEDGTLPALAAHRAKGGRVVFVRGGQVVLAEGQAEFVQRHYAALDAAGSPLQMAHVLPAAGAVWSLGLALELIGAGVETFADSILRRAA